MDNSQSTVSPNIGGTINTQPIYRIPIKLNAVKDVPANASPPPPPQISTTMNYYTVQQPTAPSKVPLVSPAPSNPLKRSAAWSCTNGTVASITDATRPPGIGAPPAVAALHADNTGSPTDAGLPAELTKLFLPMLCQLCKVQSNSFRSAQTHYESKVHNKKITIWLADWSQRTGEPVPKRAAYSETQSGPHAMHCNTCDLSLTSVLHAKQHYMGKKHNTAIAMGIRKVSGNVIKPTSDPSGRFNIGVSLVGVATAKANNGSAIVAATAATRMTPPISTISSINDSNASTGVHADVFCAVCNISVSAKTEMAKHLEGGRHARKLRAVGAAPHAPAGAAQDTVARSVAVAVALTDLSVNRTPSGQYYCKLCNVAVANENNLTQHLTSKKHVKMVAKA